MTSKQFCVIIIILTLLLILAYHINSRLDKIEANVACQNTQIINNLYQSHNTSISIEKVEGTGFAIGDNNKIDNNKA